MLIFILNYLVFYQRVCTNNIKKVCDLLFKNVDFTDF